MRSSAGASVSASCPLYVGIYPEFADQMAGFEDLMDLAIYQAMGISMGGFEEYVASTVTNLVPVIVAIYAVINGTGTLAGEEDNGRLELIAALPIPRWQIVAVKAIALGIALFLILAIVAAGGALTMSAILDQSRDDCISLGFVSQHTDGMAARHGIRHDQPFSGRIWCQPSRCSNDCHRRCAD